MRHACPHVWGTFEQIGKDLNELERGKMVLNTGEKQKNRRERQYGEKSLILHSEIQKGFSLFATTQVITKIK
jgi:hypothetical protein